ncbi:MAG: hypothetical protein JNJ65_16260 [Cyclobacteriaceae bacterium]|nr:hypothetical protein [Cyclobacteriaceae bacterium]
MKFVILYLIAFTSTITFAQTIRIADNNANAPTGANIYTTLQAAIDAAVADDIVYITPSVTSYGNATVGKRITIKGVGFGITEIAPRGSSVGILTIVNSSNGTDNISGLILTGFSFSTITFAAGTGSSPYNNIVADNITGGSFNHTACLPSATDNLTIRNSLINAINLGFCTGTSNVKIYRNINNVSFDIRNSSNALFSNNLFISTAQFNTEGTSAGIRIENNIFSGSGDSFYRLVDALVINNIFYGKTPNGATSPFHSNTFSNNLVLNAFTFPPTASGGPVNSGVNNITGTGPLFTSAPVTPAYNSTYDYTLQAGSPCIGAATTGENIGPSGGLYPWTGNLTLKPSNVPVITEFGNSGVVPQNQPLKSNIKAKSN